MRKSGVLLAVSSLPGKYGIGSFSKEAYDFVDLLEAAGQKIWQILPLGPTGYGDSPYQSFSTFAGNPYYVDLSEFVLRGWLTEDEISESYAKYYKSNDAYNKLPNDKKNMYVDYEAQYYVRFSLLRLAYQRSLFGDDEDFVQFCDSEKTWLDDYSLFMAIKDDNKGASYFEWDDKLRLRQPKAIAEAGRRLADEVGFYKFVQYFFFKQWDELKTYANSRGIEIVGDIPIYVALDSADTWAHPKHFIFDKDGKPKGVAGCPPDYFSPTGQLWGNPLYDWDYHKKEGYAWWIERLKGCLRLYDVVRIDHFRAFDEFYYIPFGYPTAQFGHWEKGPGIDLFKVIEQKLGKVNVIAEDLGFLTRSVKKLVAKTGYPGMKVLEFAFDSREDNDYLPHNYNRNCVVYTGTHDNDTVKGWYRTLGRKDRTFMKNYLGIKNVKSLNIDLIRLAESSIADTVIIPMQDVLGLDESARMNTPSTLGYNWKWRMLECQLYGADVQFLKKMTEIYGR